jgi:uncharacterized protein involved in type VI secretion and phage assembly
LPEIGDQVLAAFFDEELSKGVVLGSVWTEENPLPRAKKTPERTKTRMAKTTCASSAAEREAGLLWMTRMGRKTPDPLAR